MDYDRLLEKAVKAERDGNRQAALELYEQIATSDSEHATYAINTIKKLNEYERMAVVSPLERKPPGLTKLVMRTIGFSLGLFVPLFLMFPAAALNPGGIVMIVAGGFGKAWQLHSKEWYSQFKPDFAIHNWFHDGKTLFLNATTEDPDLSRHIATHCLLCQTSSGTRPTKIQLHDNAQLGKLDTRIADLEFSVCRTCRTKKFVFYATMLLIIAGIATGFISKLFFSFPIVGLVVLVLGAVASFILYFMSRFPKAYAEGEYMRIPNVPPLSIQDRR